MSAYDICYLDDAQESLGSALDCAVHGYGCTADDFWGAFLVSALSVQFAQGNPFVIAGMSGYELTSRVLEEVYGLQAGGLLGVNSDKANALSARKTNAMYAQEAIVERTPEYWAGWALAYYQWYSALSFTCIQESVSVEAVLAMYHPYHEMDTHAFVEAMDKRIARAHPNSALHDVRVSVRMSQSKLAELSGVSLRTIQHYEQRSKNINRAQIDHLLALSRALHCSVEQLLEPFDGSRYEYAIMHLDE